MNSIILENETASSTAAIKIEMPTCHSCERCLIFTVATDLKRSTRALGMNPSVPFSDSASHRMAPNFK